MSLQQEMRERDSDQRRLAVLKASSVPPNLVSARISNYQPSDGNAKALKAAAQVVVKPTIGLGIYGLNGVGKSRLAASIANEIRARCEVPVVMIGVNRLLGQIRESYAGAASEESAMRKAVSAPVLIIDDLDKLHLTAWSVTMFYDLMEIREQENFPLIVTSNRPYKELLARVRYCEDGIDPVTYISAMERVLEMTEDPWVEIIDRNHRRSST